tara:strand:- start:110 stop:298 length:189 start_codon:yes stop_codon:yes gene_type:complete
MKNATLTEYLQARIQTLETENKKLRKDNITLSNNNSTLLWKCSELEQQVANLKREKVAMQTR